MPKPRNWTGDFGKDWRLLGAGRPRYERCRRCTEQFWTNGRVAFYCPDCRPVVKRERDRIRIAEKRAARKSDQEFGAKALGWYMGDKVDLAALMREYGDDPGIHEYLRRRGISETETFDNDSVIDWPSMSEIVF